MHDFLRFVIENGSLFGASLIAFAVGGSFLLIIRFGTEFFAIYRNNFVTTVDKGFRDVLIYLDPSQIFTVSLGLILILVPIIYWFLGIWWAGGVLFFALSAPGIIFRNLREKRADSFIVALPDTLIALSAGLRAGLNLVKALNQVAKNQPDPISSEFAQVLVEYRVGSDLNDSLDDLAERIGREELILMNSGIKISREVGGNLADTLDVLASTIKAKHIAKGKVKALTSMGRAQAGVSIGLPILVGGLFALVEPVAMLKLFTTELGLIWLGVMTVMMVIALILIKRIINVDV